MEFEFIEQGICINGQWFPILKMEWVEGLTLDRFLEKNLYAPEKIELVSCNFKKMCAQLRDEGLAHGDLQHGNILVTREGDLKLVDYDGLFVPQMLGLTSMETGHRNYQHRARSASYFNSSLDNFSALVISSSLDILAIDASLYHRLNVEDSLLFKATDFHVPTESRTFSILEAHETPEVRRLSRLVRWQSQQTFDQLKHLSELPMEAPELGEISLFTPPERSDVAIAAESANDVSQYPKFWQRLLAREDLLVGVEPELLQPVRTVRMLPINTIEYRALPGLMFLLIWIGIAQGILPKIPYEVFFALLLPMLLVMLLALYSPIQLMGNLVAILKRLGQRRLFVAGIPARARVGFVAKRKLSDNDKYIYTVGFYVLDKGFRTTRIHADIELWNSDFRGQRAPLEGDELTILYSPNNPKNAVFYRYGQYKCCAVKSAPPRSEG